MKIALCLHGYFDSLQDPTSLGINGYNYIKKHILDKGDVDVFIHSWDKDREEEIIKLYNPKNYHFEYQKDFSPVVEELGIKNLAWSARKPENVLSHFYSIQEVFKLWLDYNCCLPSSFNYDVVIKSRFDLGQINRNTSGPGKQNLYPVQCIDFSPQYQMNKLYMANWGMMDQGPPDMWFYSNPVYMHLFSNIYDRVKVYLKSDSEYVKYHLTNTHEVEISNAVRLYKWWMQKNDIWDCRMSLYTAWE